MPRSNFYWEMSVEAVKRKEKGESTYRIHSTVQQEGGGQRWKHKFPSPHLTHLFICLYPLPVLPALISRLVSQCPEPPYIIVLRVVIEEIHWQWSKLFHFSQTISTREIAWSVAKKYFCTSLLSLSTLSITSSIKCMCMYLQLLQMCVCVIVWGKTFIKIKRKTDQTCHEVKDRTYICIAYKHGRT